MMAGLMEVVFPHEADPGR